MMKAMDAKIKEALIFLLGEEDIASSWGFSNITISDTSISFHVDGFIYKGGVCIRCDNQCYHVTFDDGRTFSCSLYDLVSALDSSIEKNDSYIHNLEVWFSDSNKEG